MRTVVVSSLILCVAAAGLWLWRRQVELDAHAAQVQAELAANRQTMQELKAQRGAGLRPPEGKQPAPKAASKPIGASMARGTAIRQRLLHLPEYAPFLRREHQRRAIEQYGPWFAQLTASPERLAIVKQAIADRIATGQDAFEEATSAGYRMGTREFEDLMHCYDKEGDARLAELLTAKEFASYKGYEKVKWFTRDDLPLMHELFVERGVPPLDGAQVVALAAAWQRAEHWKPSTALPPGVLTRARREQVLELVGTALSTEQRDGLAAYIGYLNSKSQRLGQLYRPEDPDGVSYSAAVAGR